MSWEAFNWAKTWRLPPSEKFVLVMLGDHYNEQVHRAWPSYQTLADETGLSRRTVIRSIAALEQNGLVEVEPWVDAETLLAMSNRYCLPLYDAKSARAIHVPVKATRSFDKTDRSYRVDTHEHAYQHGEEVPGYER